MASLQELLDPQVLTRVISRQAATSSWLTSLFGVGPGGRNELDFGHGRTGQYNIYNNVRTIGKVRAPGTAAGRSNPQGMSSVPFTYPRMHDSVSLLAETMNNIGRIDNPAQRDQAGERWIMQQTRTLSQRAANFRLAQLVGTLQGGMYVQKDGDDFYFSLTSGSAEFQIGDQMPAGNKSQLDMLGGGDIIDASWATSSTDIPDHIGQINAAFQQLNGGHLAAVICGQQVWNNVIQNTKVSAIHGSATAPFRTLERSALDPAVANTTMNAYAATINVWPDVVWYITDEGLDIGAPGSETYTKFVGNSNAVFVGFNPGGDDVLSCYKGGEPIAEYDNGPKTDKRGLNAWSVERSNPTTTELFTLDNALVVNHVPNSLAYGTVVF
jgi:hypothetical protein